MNWLWEGAAWVKVVLGMDLPSGPGGRVRMNLERDPKPRQEGLARLLGKGLVPSREAIAFWRFFPRDVPVSTLETMLQGGDKGINQTDFAGCATWKLGAVNFLFLCYISERI